MKIAPAALVVALIGCDADLSSDCIGGDCSPYVPETPSPPECYEECDVTMPSFTSGEYPCAVDAIMDNCRRCHVPGGIAPFSLDTYADAQVPFFGRTPWGRMDAAVRDDFMPLDPPKLTDDEKQILLDEWACRCAPPRPAGEVCD